MARVILFCVELESGKIKFIIISWRLRLSWKYASGQPLPRAWQEELIMKSTTIKGHILVAAVADVAADILDMKRLVSLPDENESKVVPSLPQMKQDVVATAGAIFSSLVDDDDDQQGFLYFHHQQY